MAKEINPIKYIIHQVELKNHVRTRAKLQYIRTILSINRIKNYNCCVVQCSFDWTESQVCSSIWRGSDSEKSLTQQKCLSELAQWAASGMPSQYINICVLYIFIYPDGNSIHTVSRLFFLCSQENRCYKKEKAELESNSESAGALSSSVIGPWQRCFSDCCDISNPL